MVDYMIVGAGLAGIAFAEKALQHGKTILVFDSGGGGSSAVAAGLYNPVILKRFSGLQDAQAQLDALHLFYTRLEQKLNRKLLFPMPIWRQFHSVEEQNEWFAASDKPALAAFLSTDLQFKTLPFIDAPFGYGAVLQTGYADTQLLLAAYRNYLEEANCIVQGAFDYSNLQLDDRRVVYKGIAAKHIIFAEGFGIKNNPYFNPNAVNGTKGELLVIKAAGLRLDVIVKAGLFVLPLGDGLYKVGATYQWDDKSPQPTARGRAELIVKLSEIISCDYEIVSHLAGIRPTTRDRKPLLGTHASSTRMHLFNGLGTRGVMLAPYLAEILYAHIENGAPIPKELDFKRFDHLTAAGS